MFSLARMNQAQQVSTLEDKIDQLVKIITEQSKRIEELELELGKNK